METIECTKRVEVARRCLTLISSIAARGACSENPGNIGYAIAELSQVLFERTGSEDIIFEPVPADQIHDLDRLLEELMLVDAFALDLESSNTSDRELINGVLELDAPEPPRYGVGSTTSGTSESAKAAPLRQAVSNNHKRFKGAVN